MRMGAWSWAARGSHSDPGATARLVPTPRPQQELEAACTHSTSLCSGWRLCPLDRGCLQESREPARTPAAQTRITVLLPFLCSLNPRISDMQGLRARRTLLTPTSRGM